MPLAPPPAIVQHFDEVKPIDRFTSLPAPIIAGSFSA